MNALAVAGEALHIERLSHDGRGVGRRGGKAIFVARALPGEMVVPGRVQRHRRYDEAELGEVLEPAETRVEPCCRHFGICGGCALQHMAAPAQLAAKQALLLENLERLAGLRPEILWAPITGPAYGYRRRARFGVRYVRAKRRVLVGFRETNGRYITDAQSCPILVPAARELPQALAELIAGLDLRTHVPQVEFAAGDAAAALVFRTLGETGGDDLERLVAFGHERGFSVWIQPAGYDSLRLVYGAPLLGYTLPAFGVTLHFLPTDFVQINAAVNRKLVAAALARLEIGSGDRVLELYSGIGNFSLALARCAGRVVTVEGDAALVRRARANAAANGLANLEQHVADLETCGERSDWLAGPYDAVLMDPPRSGARTLVPALRRLAPARILYVSCHPATLARDGAALAAAGFRLKAAGVADMFPQTAHAEALALFVAG